VVPRARGIAWRLLISLLVIAGVLAAVFGAYTVTRGRTPAIAGPNAIASLEKVTLGALQQHVLIRGADRTNPVLLFLHGGPGMPAMYLAHAFQEELEHDFVVVQWDRAGAGKSFAGTPPSVMKVSQQIADTVELTNHLRNRFGQAKIYLLGHSWGTYLGMLTIAAHPELYHAYIGVGQVAHSVRAAELMHAFVRGEAQRRGDGDAVAALAQPEEQIDYESLLFRYGGELYHETSFLPILLTGLRAPEYTLEDALNVRKGPQFAARHMQYDVIEGELMDEVRVVRTPIYFFLGRHDYTAPATLAEAYFNMIEAPSKRLVWFEDSAHFAFWEESARFAAEMRAVRR
jgi:pimeloyl-ACP methyl ester carboxylesterase